MRLLNTGDLFAAARVLKLLNAKELLRGAAYEIQPPELPDDATEEEKTDASEKALFDIGYDIIWDLVTSASDRKTELAIYEFLSRPYEITPAEVEAMSLDDQIEHLKQLAKDNNLAYFFEQALRLRR